MMTESKLLSVFFMEIRQIKENCLYVKNLKNTLEFYEGIMQFKLISFVEGRHVFFRAGSSVLLCFLPEVTKAETKLPAHYAYGRQHLAFEIPFSEYQEWKDHLLNNKIDIIHQQHWKDDLYSFYFYDPDHHLLEIVPPGIWD